MMATIMARNTIKDLTKAIYFLNCRKITEMARWINKDCKPEIDYQICQVCRVMQVWQD